jgi:hypothetical protein
MALCIIQVPGFSAYLWATSSAGCSIRAVPVEKQVSPDTIGTDCMKNNEAYCLSGVIS